MHIVWYQKQLLYLSKPFTVSLLERFCQYFDVNSVTSQFHTVIINIIVKSPLYNIT